LLASPWKNALTGQSIQSIFPNEPISLCFGLYPVFISSHIDTLFNSETSKQEIDRLFQQYIDELQWKAVSSLQFNLFSNGSNAICTRPFKITEAAPVSFILSLPNFDFFHSVFLAEKNKTDLDIQQYGVKMLLANATFTNNQLLNPNMDIMDSETNFEQNYSQMIPLVIFRHQINFSNL
jgi:hypothetical protein